MLGEDDNWQGSSFVTSNYAYGVWHRLVSVPAFRSGSQSPEIGWPTISRGNPDEAIWCTVGLQTWLTQVMYLGFNIEKGRSDHVTLSLLLSCRSLFGSKQCCRSFSFLCYRSQLFGIL